MLLADPPMRLVGLLALGLLVGCAAADDPSGETASEVTTSVLGSKKELFDEPMLFVRIKDWDGDPDALRNQKDEAKLGANASLEIYKARPDSAEHCPAPGAPGHALVFSSPAFTLRTSGNMTNGTPKSSFKLSLEDKDDRLFGMKSLNLKSMWNDVSQMREGVAWRLFREAGVVASQHTYAKLCVDGKKNGQPFTKYMGLFSVIEQVDKAMLKDHFGKKNDGGNLYKGEWPAGDLGPATLGYRSANGDDSGKQYKIESDGDARTYQLKTNEDDPALATYDDLATFIRVVNGKTTPGAEPAKFATPAYATAVEEIFDTKGFLRWAALNSLMGAWDNYWASPANYYLYDSGRKDAGDAFMAKPYFTWIPWDYDNVLGVHFSDAKWAEASITDLTSYDGRTSNMANLAVLRHLFENDAFLRYYLDAIEHLNDTLFTVAHVGGITSGLRARVENAAFLEGDLSLPAHTGRQFTNDEIFRHGLEHHELRRGGTFILGIEHFVRMRHENVARQIAQLRTSRAMPKGGSGGTFPARPTPLP